MTRQTIGSRLDANRGIGPGFDFLRIGLACGIVAWHVNAVVSGDLSQDSKPYVWLVGYALLAAFFSLSGFLIAGSALRLSLRNFLINRGLRIVPALAVEVVLCALLLGPWFTSLSLSQYFSDPMTRHYFTNIVGLINFHLPGVFAENPLDIVNNTLWTIPHELGCYVIMSVLMVTGMLVNRVLTAGLAVTLMVAGIACQRAGLNADSLGPGALAYVMFLSPASRLYVFFTTGISIFLYRHSIPYSRAGLAGCVGFALVVGSFPQLGGVDYPLANVLLAAPLCYVTACLGVTRIWVPAFLRRGDYSYGIYLYGWPLQQTLVALLPSLKSWPLQFMLVMPLITLFAAFSWHCIERPILQIRRRFSFVARVRLAETVEAPTDQSAADAGPSTVPYGSSKLPSP